MKIIPLYSFLLASLFIGYSSLSLAENLKVYGSLISTPCKLTPENGDIKVEFEPLILKELYENKPKIDKKEFVISLTECDLSAGSSNFKVKFSGVESPNLKGYLAIEQANFTQDIGIAIELNDGTLLPINQSSPAMKLLNSGLNEIKFRTFLTPTDKAIADKTIKTGTFSAKAVFSFEYY